MVCAVFIGILAAFANPHSSLQSSSRAEDSAYNLLVQGFRAGQLNLKMPVPPELRGVTNYYAPLNPADNSVYIKGATDFSYYQGKMYLYYGVTPVLVLFWPYAALTGHYLPDQGAVVAFFALGFFIAAALLRDIGRRYFPEANISMVVACLFVSGLAMALAVYCDVNEAAVTCGFAFMMLALAAIWQAMHSPKRGIWWLLLASLAYGLAAGARPSLVFGIVVLLIPVVQARYKASEQSPCQHVGLFLAAVIPAMLVGLGLMLYNDRRFGNPYEFGWHYQLDQFYRPISTKQFSLHYVWFNFQYYFLETPRLNSHLPFLQPRLLYPVPVGYDPGARVDYGGILSNYPLVFLVSAVPLVWRKKPVEAGVPLCWLVAALFLLFVTCGSVIWLFCTSTIRYELDFLPALLLLACVGVFGLESALADLPLWRRRARWGLGVLLAWSVVFDLMISMETHAGIDCLAGNSFLSGPDR